MRKLLKIKGKNPYDKLSELRHKVPAKLKSEWLDRENALIDQELSKIQKETSAGIFAEINGNTLFSLF